MHERLRRGRDVTSVLRRGRRTGGDAVVVHVRHRSDDHPARLAVVASRRAGGAVARNRAKRVLRAAAASIDWPRGVDVALVAKATTGELGALAVSDELRQLAEQMFDDRTTSPGGHQAAVSPAGRRR